MSLTKSSREVTIELPRAKFSGKFVFYKELLENIKHLSTIHPRAGQLISGKLYRPVAADISVLGASLIEDSDSDADYGDEHAAVDDITRLSSIGSGADRETEGIRSNPSSHVPFYRKGIRTGI